MMNFFRAIDNFLQACVDYITYRVFTGKFVTDIKYLNADFQRYRDKKEKAFAQWFYQSPYTKAFAAFLLQQNTHLRKIPIIGDIVALIIQMLYLMVSYFLEFVIVLAITIISFLFLSSLFDTSALLFVGMLIPLLLFLLLVTASLFYVIDKQEKHEQATFFDGLQFCFTHLSSFFLLLCSHVFIIFGLIIFFFLFAFLVSTVFNYLQIPWENAFSYWVLVIPALLFTILGIFSFFILSYHAYIIVLSERHKPLVALKKSLRYIQVYPLQNMFFFLIVLLCFMPIFSWTYASYFVFGTGIAVALLGQTLMLLTLILRKLFPQHNEENETYVSAEWRYLFIFLFVIGSITYVISGVLFMQQYNNIQAFIWQEQQKSEVASELTDYYNKDENYLISYPKIWTVYHWQNKSTTLYNNYTGSNEGGIWVNISIIPDYNTDFAMLQKSKPGLIAYNTGTQSILTKVSDISVQGYPGVKYTYSLPRTPSPEYHIHYLINKNSYVYDIDFLTTSKVTQADNLDLFDTIFASFRFTTDQ